MRHIPDRKVCVANMGPTWVLSAPDGPHVGPMNLAIGDVILMDQNREAPNKSTLQWRHNGRDGVSNRQTRDCLLKRLFRCRSKKTSKLRVTGLCEGNSPGPVNSPHKGPVTREMFPFDDVIMKLPAMIHLSLRRMSMRLHPWLSIVHTMAACWRGQHHHRQYGYHSGPGCHGT